MILDFIDDNGAVIGRKNRRSSKERRGGKMTVMHGGSGVILPHHTGSRLPNARSFLPARQMKFP
jgi:hypothetical protein